MIDVKIGHLLNFKVRTTDRFFRLREFKLLSGAGNIVTFRSTINLNLYFLLKLLLG